MAFGQPLGPPATHRQIGELLALLQAAGHVDFRDARGPMGFTQRQGNGKFTRDEADAFIAQLTDGNSGLSDEQTTLDNAAPVNQSVATRPVTSRAPVTAAQRRAATQARTIHDMPSELLAAELQRRGWAVIEP